MTRDVGHYANILIKGTGGELHELDFNEKKRYFLATDICKDSVSHQIVCSLSSSKIIACYSC